MNNNYNYKAFISYSHKDERWATWLHRALESYRLPKNLVGTTTAVGTIPRRLNSIFRDRDDLSSSADLSAAVVQSLLESENLIVICSPHAAASDWVNQEIREFVRLGRQDRIFCVIVDGGSADGRSGSVDFPPALTEGGKLEPLAADARQWADGKHLARLKIISGMLGLPLDQLRRRDLQKRQRTWAVSAIAAIAVIAVVISAVLFQIAAQQRRDSGESLVAYKLTELRTLLKVKDDPESLTRLDQWDAQELADLINSAGNGPEALLTAAMKYRKAGQGYWNARELDLAMPNFEQSWALLAEHYGRHRSDSTAFFELGQAVYWIGRVHEDSGDLEAAEVAFMAYAEITRRLIKLQPENAEWVLEMSYALTNLGGLQKLRHISNPERTLQLMQSALEYNQIALVLDPKNSQYQSELGQSHLNLADAQLNVCDLDGAMQTMSASIQLENELWLARQRDLRRMRFLAFALSGYASVRIQQGHLADAEQHLERSLALLESVNQSRTETPGLMRQILVRQFHIARLQALQDKTAEAKSAFEAMEADWTSLYEGATEDDLRLILRYVEYLFYRSSFAQSQGELPLAEQLLKIATDRLVTILSDFPGNREAENLIALYVFQNWELQHSLPTASISTFLPNYAADVGRTRACSEADIAVRMAIMQGETHQAASLTNYLLDRGYHEADFMRVCRTYNLCK